MEAIVDIHNATVYRGNTRVFAEFSLSLQAGQHTAILGPNGAGKSTLLKLLSQELYPVYGDDTWVHLFGRDRWNVWELRARLGIISNDLHSDYAGHVRGLDVVLSGFYSSIGTYDYQRFSPGQLAHCERIIAELDLDNIKQRPFGAMSTGQQRRFLLARALIQEPVALVLDEPTSGLDLKATFQYLRYIRRLMRRHRTVVLVTHHIHEIPPEIERVVLLDKGVIVADGEKSTLLSDARLSELFGIPLKVVSANGYYQVFPA